MQLSTPAFFLLRIRLSLCGTLLCGLQFTFLNGKEEVRHRYAWLVSFWLQEEGVIISYKRLSHFRENIIFIYKIDTPVVENYCKKDRRFSWCACTAVIVALFGSKT